jgi:hypothetical protein
MRRGRQPPRILALAARPRQEIFIFSPRRLPEGALRSFMPAHNPTPDASVSLPQTDRPVLLWQEEGDASRVEPSVERAAEFLHSTVPQVLTAIHDGDVLDGWFVDWQPQRA